MNRLALPAIGAVRAAATIGPNRAFIHPRASRAHKTLIKKVDETKVQLHAITSRRYSDVVISIDPAYYYSPPKSVNVYTVT